LIVNFIADSGLVIPNRDSDVVPCSDHLSKRPQPFRNHLIVFRMGLSRAELTQVNPFAIELRASPIESRMMAVLWMRNVKRGILGNS